MKKKQISKLSKTLAILVAIFCLVSCGLFDTSSSVTSVGDVSINAADLSTEFVKLGSDDTLSVANIDSSKSYIFIMDDVNSRSIRTKAATQESKGSFIDLNDYITSVLGESYGYIMAAEGTEFESTGANFGYEGIRKVKMKDIATTNGCIDLAKEDNKLFFYDRTNAGSYLADYYVYAGNIHFEAETETNDVKIKDKGVLQELYIIQDGTGKSNRIGKDFFGFTDNNGNIQTINSNNVNGVFKYSGSANHINFVRAFIGCVRPDSKNNNAKLYAILVNPKRFSTSSNTLTLTNTANAFHISIAILTTTAKTKNTFLSSTQKRPVVSR